MIEYVRAAAKRDENGDPISEAHQIVVFPGMEVTLELPCQALVLFDADLPQELLSHLPGALGYEQTPEAEESAAQTEKLTNLSHPNDLAERLNSLSYLRDRFIILPHVSENGHQTLIRRGFDAHYRRFCENGAGVGGYTDGALPSIGTGARNILDGIDPAYGKNALAVFQTSDCRRSDFSTLGKFSTWVKWSKPTAEALRQSCLARHSRISQTQPEVPGIAITRIEISASKFLGKQNLFLSDQYNALIGGRGTGKSTLLEYARWALCAQPNGALEPSSREHERRSHDLVEGTLRSVSGSVRVHMNVHGVHHLVERRTSGEGTLLLKVGSDELREADATEVRRLLPVEVYSQKQLSSVGGTPEDVLQFVLAPVARQVGTIDDELDRAGDALRASFGALRSSQRASTEAARLSREAASLREQRDSLQTALASLDPNDAEAVRSATLYSAEVSLRGRWRDDLEQARASIQKLAKILESAPASLPEGAKLPDSELLESMQSELSARYDEARNAVGAAAQALGEGALNAFNRKGDSLEERIAEARERFKVAKERTRAHEEAIKQAETVSERIEDIEARLAAIDREAPSVDGASKAFENASKHWTDLVRKRGVIAEQRCRLIEERAGGLVRAETRIAADLSGPLAALVDMARGSRVRAERFDGLRDYLDGQPNPLNSWLTTLGELRNLIGLDADESTLPPCPTLHASGFKDKELRAIANRLDDESWMRLRLSLPSDAVKFSYCSREGEYIDFAHASAGQRATALMRALLADEGAPLLIDQPEDDLDNRVIHEIAADIWKAKTRRQLIFASHNANLVVNGDADLVVVFDYEIAGEQTSGVVAAQGAIDDEDVRSGIAEVMEGGRDAFQLRASKYGF